jgi:hypothetical protein
MATKKPWELDYEPTVEQALQAPAALSTQGEKPWERMYQTPAPVAAADQVPTQRIRSLAQGATFGLADELESYIRTLTGEKREAALADVRKKLKAYQTARPMESLGYELAGSVPTSLATAGAASQLPLLQRLPQVARLAAGGAAAGGVTGFGTSEREGVERLRDVPVAGAIGAVTGPAAYYGVRAGGAVADGVMDFARRAMGGRGAKAVETEIQRLASESGLTADEIVQRVARGEIMAENETLRAAVRGYYTQGGEASQTIAGALTRRPEALRQQAMGQLQRGLTPGISDNVLQQAKLDDDAIRLAERAMYGEAFARGGVVEKPLLDAFATAMQRSPAARRSVNELFQAETGRTPFYRVLPDGNIEYSRTPTLEEMEIARRGIQQTVNQMYQGGKGATGGALKDIELQLRELINQSSPAVATARQSAAQTRSAREAFQDGRKAFAKSADEVQVMFADMNEGQVRAFRSGLMDALRARAATGSRNTLVANLADPRSKEGQILRTAFPGDMLEQTLDLLGLAAQSRQAASTIMGGSSTAANLAQQQRAGSRVSAEELIQFGLNPVSTIRTTGKVIDMLRPNLSEAQRNRVAQILVSEDAEVVRNALTDNSLMAQLQQRINQVVEGMATAASGAAAYAPPARLGQ